MKSLYLVLLSTLTICFLATSVDTIKCHVCEPDEDDDNSCKGTDFGEVEDNCVYCYAEEMKEKQVKRWCMEEEPDDTMGCTFDGEGLQFCNCNHTDLCNVLKPLINCYVCNSVNEGSNIPCTTQSLGTLKGGCLQCFSAKMTDAQWERDCLVNTEEPGCRYAGDLNSCFCDSDRCNAKDIILHTMKCYVCKPKSATDTNCNVANSGRVQDGCMTCVTEISKTRKTIRSCSEYATSPSTDEVEGSTIIRCDKDLCNGEGETSTSRALRKTVAGRVLIGGLLAAMLGLAQLF